VLLVLLLLCSVPEEISDGTAVEISSPEIGEVGESGRWARYCFLRLSRLDSISSLSHCSVTAADLKMLRRRIANDLLHCRQKAEEVCSTADSSSAKY
jgi:hypothetical protein